MLCVFPMRCLRRIVGILVLAWVLDSTSATMEDASEVTWAHAVNSREALERALASTVDFLEADVSLGHLKGEESSGATVPVMAHPPSTTSDITLDQWLTEATARGDKGFKLDFKSIDVLEPSLLILQRHASKLRSSSLWLNADIVAGPVDSPTLPVDPNEFISKCRLHFPSSTLSVGWTTYWHPVVTPAPSTWHYEWQHARMMADALHCGLYMDSPRLPNGLPSPEGDTKVTFPVRGIFASRSISVLRWLLSIIPGSSLTIWSGRYDPLEVDDLLRIRSSFPKSKVFYDVPNPLRQRFDELKDSVVVPPEDSVGGDAGRWMTLTEGAGEGCTSLTYAGDRAVVFGRSARTAVLWKALMDPSSARVEGLVEFLPQTGQPTPQALTFVVIEVSRFARSVTPRGLEDMTTSDSDVIWSAIDMGSVITFRTDGGNESSCRAFKLNATADRSFEAWTLKCHATHEDWQGGFNKVTEVSSWRRLVLPEEPHVFGLVAEGDGHVVVHNLTVSGTIPAVTVDVSGARSANVASLMPSLLALLQGLAFFL